MALRKQEPEDLSDDVLLMRRIVQKDKAAFSQLIDMHMSTVFRFSYSLLQDQALAEDVAQDVFLKLWNNGEGWQPTGRVKSWLLRIAHNLSIDEIRKRKPSIELDDDVYEIPEERSNPEDNTNRVMVEGLVKSALMQLPARQKAAIMLIYYSQCTNKEGAEILDVSVEAFESLLARAKNKLKISLEEVKDNY